MGADGFLVKPVNVKDVVTLVPRALEERTSLAPLPSAREAAAASESSGLDSAETLVEGHARAS